MFLPILCLLIFGLSSCAKEGFFYQVKNAAQGNGTSCSCPLGYTVNADGSGCQGRDLIAPNRPLDPTPIIIGDADYRMTKTFCVTIPSPQSYVLHVGADNDWKVKIDGKDFAACG